MRPVTFASAVAPSRLLASLFVVASVLAFLLVGRAEGAGRSSNAYLAPTGACRAADDASAPAAHQVRAVACLVNWARAQDRRSRFARRSALHRAAELKGERVASCGQFSHTPCGAKLTAGVNAVRIPLRDLRREPLSPEPGGRVSPRDVVNAWLQSPPHRANMLGAAFRHVGVAPVRANGLLDGTDAVVWTATFASPR